MHHETEPPNHDGARQIEHHAVDAREMGRDGDARGIEGATRKQEEQHNTQQGPVVFQQGDCVDGIFQVTAIIARDHPEQRIDDEDHDQGSPKALEADNLHGRQIDLLHEILLRDDLAGLDDLPREHEAHAKEHGRGVAVCGAHALRSPDVGHADDRHAEDAKEQADPIEGKQLPLQEHHREDGREHHCRSSEHLPDACGDVEHADGAEGRGRDVEGSRHDNQHDLLAVRRTARAAPVVDPVDHKGGGHGAAGRIALPVDLVNDPDQAHSEEHVQRRKPRLVEQLGLAIDANAGHGELDLGAECVQSSSQEHTDDVEYNHPLRALAPHCSMNALNPNIT
mmetsp:Transcript_29280/g.84023  ORF Transcript_29280/g.84023 Transcript_29280/m.84023 type:complete len:338 (-) Transcript_29280:36-1049(-)